MPALLTRMSSEPIAASAAGTSFSTSSGLPRLQASTWARSPSSAFSASSTSARVPEMATAAPLPVQRPRDRRADAARGAGHQRGLSGEIEHVFLSLLELRRALGDVVRACRWPVPCASGAVLFTSPDKTLPAPTSQKSLTPWAAISAMLSRQRTVPVTCSTSALLISAGIGQGRRQHIGEDRHGRRAHRRIGERLRHHLARRAASRRNGKARSPAASWRAWRPCPWPATTARSTAALWPDTTTWPGALSLAAWQISPCAAASATAAASG